MGDVRTRDAMRKPVEAAKDFAKHPLQRLESPGRGISLAIHVASMASFVKAFHYLTIIPNPLVTGSYGWHFQYLTILGLSIATITCAFGLVADIFLSTRFFSAKNALSAVSTPLEVLISILYWGLVLINKELVAPPGMTIPMNVDLSLHAAPAVLLTIDLIFLSPPWAVSMISAMATSGIFAFIYWFWVERCHAYNGWYPYPIFELLNTTQRVGLFCFAALIMALNTLFLDQVYRRTNSPRLPVT